MVGWHHRLNGDEFEQTPGEWRTRRPGVLQPVGPQRVGHDGATGQQQLQSLSRIQGDTVTSSHHALP